MENHLLVAIVALVSYGAYRVHRSLFYCPKELEDVPVVPILPMIARLLFSPKPMDERVHDLKDLKEKKNGLVRTWFFGRWLVLAENHELTRRIFKEPDLFQKVSNVQLNPEGPGARFFGDASIVFSNGNVWKKYRRIANPAFPAKWPTTTFGECGRVLLDEMSAIDQKPIDIHGYMQRLTLDVLGLAAFNFDFQALRNPNSDFVVKYNHAMDASTQPLNTLFPFISRMNLPWMKKTKESIDAFDELLFRIIRERKEAMKGADNVAKEKQEKKDLLQLMLEASERGDVIEDKDGDGPLKLTLTDRELRDNLLIFFVAGHDTTSHSLCTVFYHLAKYPEMQEKVRQELAENGLADKPEGYIPTYEEQSNLPLMTRIIFECLRLYPPASILPMRVTMSDIKVGDVTLPKGTMLLVNVLNRSRDPAVWKNPDAFCPARFDPSDAAGRAGVGCPAMSSTDYLPFGQGKRICIGKQFSLIEQRVIISMVLAKYHISLPDDSPHKEKLRLKPVPALLMVEDLKLNFKRHMD